MRTSYLFLSLSFVVACGSNTDTTESEVDAGSDVVTSDSDTSEPDTGGSTSDSGADTEADGADTGGVDLNACGGTATLSLDGEDATPGDECGVCNDGVVVCSGPDALRCVGASAANPCGGCGGPAGEESESCGPCGDGIWTCNAEDQLACEGNSLANACGGCTVLDAPPLFLCESESGAPGTQICEDPDTTVCFTGGVNACGGSSSLPQEPGAACGECGTGRWVCDGVNDVSCAEELNACGGCAPLEGEPGESCGTCGNGEWTCDDTSNRVTCTETRNACGGCDPLQNAPLQPCDDGTFSCSGANALVCNAEEANACGGAATLDELPGVPCGPCEDGITQCASPDSVECIGSRATNACGTCGELAGRPGETCGRSGLFVCSEDGVECEEGARFACGGDAPPLDESGEEVVELGPCGGCDLGRQVCSSESTVVCVQSVLYVDADGDGYGDTDSAITDLGDSCPTDVSLVAVPGDCDDENASVFPAQPESPGDGIDLNCDGEETCYVDGDFDGFRGALVVVSADPDCDDPGEALLETGLDCDDTNEAIFPGADEIPGDGTDQNCDAAEVCYVDADEDGRRDPAATVESEDLACDAPREAAASAAEDCDDDDTNVWSSCETCEDGDEDGFHVGCDRYETYEGPDCDDSDAVSYPGAPELCDGNDNECRGEIPVAERDTDGDGYVVCSFSDVQGDDAFLGGDDCDPDDPDVWISCATCVDSDDDGYFVGCDAYVINEEDCNDDAAEANPDETEVCGDGLDNDCDGTSNGCRFEDEEEAYVLQETEVSAGPLNSTAPWFLNNVGDIDGDGLDEMVFSDPHAWGSGGPLSGRAYIFDADLTGRNDLASVDNLLMATGARRQAVGDVFEIPDVDDDGRPEWLFTNAPTDSRRDISTAYLLPSSDESPPLPAWGIFPESPVETRALTRDDSDYAVFEDACVANMQGPRPLDGSGSNEIILSASGSPPRLYVVEDGAVPDGESVLATLASAELQFPTVASATEAFEIECADVSTPRNDIDLIVGVAEYTTDAPLLEANTGALWVLTSDLPTGSVDLTTETPNFVGLAGERIGSALFTGDFSGTSRPDIIIGGTDVTYVIDEGPRRGADSAVTPSVRIAGWEPLLVAQIDGAGTLDVLLTDGERIDVLLGETAAVAGIEWDPPGELVALARGSGDSIWAVVRDGGPLDRTPLLIRLAVEDAAWVELARVYLPHSPYVGSRLENLDDINGAPGVELAQTLQNSGDDGFTDFSGGFLIHTATSSALIDDIDGSNNSISSLAVVRNDFGIETFWVGRSHANRHQGAVSKGDDPGSISAGSELVVSDTGMFGWDMALCAGWGSREDWLAVSAPTSGNGEIYFFSVTPLSRLRALTPAAVLSGSVEGDLFGYHLDCSSDLTGDGVVDLVVSAPDGQPGRSGAVHVYAGATDDAFASGASPAFEMTGTNIGDQFGFDFAVVDDVNGDGVSDVVVGAPGADVLEDGAGTTRIDAGAAFLFLSPHSGTRDADAADARFSSFEDGAQLGLSVEGGDVDGDGETDLMFTEQVTGERISTRVLLRYGPLMDPTRSEEVTLTSDRRPGEPAGAYDGRDIEVVDINGDGILDIVLTTREQQTLSATEGALRYFGRPGY